MSRKNVFIDTQAALSDALGEMGDQPVLGVDTESNSFFVYRERTCLVQVSSADADWIIDPFAVDLAPFGEILAEPRIEKIFHASEMDVVSLRRDFGFQVENLFDTLVAAKAVGRKKLGLAGLLEDLLELKIGKEEQRSDWGRRPLTDKQIAYAFNDTRHLLELSALLKAEVAAKGPVILEEVQVDCRRMALKEARVREVDPEGFERHALARRMDPVARQVLRSLFHARETRAQEMDRPLFRVLGDQTLGEIAVRKPTTRHELGQIPGVTSAVIGRHGDLLLAAVQEGVERGPLPVVRRSGNGPDPLEEERFERLRRWRKAVAEARGVEVDVIAGNAALKALARANPQSVQALEEIAELDPFRRAHYGEPMLRAMEGK